MGNKAKRESTKPFGKNRRKSVPKKNDQQTDIMSQEKTVAEEESPKRKKLNNDQQTVVMSQEKTIAKDKSPKRKKKLDNDQQTDVISQEKTVVEDKSPKRKRKLDNDQETDVMSQEKTVTEDKSSKRKKKLDNDQQTDEMSQEKTVAKDKSRKKKKKLDNDQQTDVMSHEKTVAKDQSRKKKKKLNNASNDSNADISKGNSDESVKSPPKSPSKRQLKKQKIAYEQEIAKKVREEIAKEKAYCYLLLWRDHRNEWRFEKLRQIWLVDHLVYKNSITDDMFPTVLDYFKECKGQVRQVLVEKAMKIITSTEEETNENDKEVILNSTAYKRAREILQILPVS